MVNRCHFLSNSIVSPVGSQNGVVDFIPASTTSWVRDCNFVGNTYNCIGMSMAGNVRNCGFTNNIGTCVRSAGSGAQVDTCTFTGNSSAGNGSCMYLIGTTVTNCTFSGNSASASGGALFLGPGPGSSITRCQFFTNMTSGNGSGGGVVYANQANTTGVFINCLFAGNYTTAANADGGVLTLGSTGNWTFRNCGFFGNQAGNRGGALYLRYALSNVIDSCTFANNMCGAANGGGACYDYATGSCYTNCIIYSNMVNAVATQDVYCITNCTFQNCCLAATNFDSLATFSSCTTNYPRFVNAGTVAAGTPYGTNLLSGSYDFRLTKSSPCRDAGTNETWMTGALDLFGNARILNNIVDIGCYEYLAPPASGTAVFFR